jgi:hypothetical protein
MNKVLRIQGILKKCRKYLEIFTLFFKVKWIIYDKRKKIQYLKDEIIIFELISCEI